MKIVIFFNPCPRDVIEKILEHCGLLERCARAPPTAGGPDAEPLRELRYESDLEFVDEPAPAEPLWTAD